MSTLHGINPNAYPNPPVLTEEEKAENRRWVAQRRAENAAKESEKPASNIVVATAATTPVAEQNPISSDKPTQYRVFTADGWKPIYQGYKASHTG